MDPIGLAGGNPTLYGYVSNPTIILDIFGLSLIRYKPHDSLTAMPGIRDTAINRAWALEKKLIMLTGSGTRNWTQAEIDLIISTPNENLKSKMSNKGYTGHHINSFKGNGDLGIKWQADPRNIVFLENKDHPNGNRHKESSEGHRGSYRNATKGRLIDRQEMINQHIKCRS